MYVCIPIPLLLHSVAIGAETKRDLATTVVFIEIFYKSVMWHYCHVIRTPHHILRCSASYLHHLQNNLNTRYTWGKFHSEYGFCMKCEQAHTLFFGVPRLYSAIHFRVVICPILGHTRPSIAIFVYWRIYIIHSQWTYGTVRSIWLSATSS